jgi:hypothetical protein
VPAPPARAAQGRGRFELLRRRVARTLVRRPVIVALDDHAIVAILVVAGFVALAVLIVASFVMIAVLVVAGLMMVVVTGFMVVVVASFAATAIVAAGAAVAAFMVVAATLAATTFAAAFSSTAFTAAFSSTAFATFAAVCEGAGDHGRTIQADRQSGRKADGKGCHSGRLQQAARPVRLRVALGRRKLLAVDGIHRSILLKWCWGRPRDRPGRRLATPS